jgi:tRNA modification GTPase
MDGEGCLDEVLVSLFRAPRSFTGEESVEISCHGSTYIQQRLLQLLILAGARLATPGEFTRRSFLNGKMDLPRAEAVMDLLSATSSSAHEMAMNQMRGGFSSGLMTLRGELLRVASLLELELDFPEEDVTFADRVELVSMARRVHDLISGLRDSFSLGNALKTGIPVAIVGPPNAGKSTLLNTLLREERAIVSEREGTTRDAIEETLDIEGVTFRFIDTAGIRVASDEIEAIGISRAFMNISRARVVLLLLDDTRLASFARYYGQVRDGISPGASLILLLNKVDSLDDPAAIVERLRALAPGEPLLPLSAKTGEGIEPLTRLLLATVTAGLRPASGTLVNNLRHYEALTRAGQATTRLLAGLEAGLGGEILSQDLRECIHYIGEITGEITTDEILGNIFKHFCIGK